MANDRDGSGFAGLLVVDLHIAGSASLKDKRRHLRSITAHLENAGFSVAEVAHQDTWQRSQLAISMVAGGSGNTEHRLDEAFRICERTGADVVTRQRAVLSLADLD